MKVRDLARLISFWEGKLQYDRYLMNPSVIELIRQTVMSLKELKELKEGE